MLDAAAKALSQILSPPMRRILWRSIGLALMLVAVAAITLQRVLSWLATSGEVWAEGALGPGAEIQTGGRQRAAAVPHHPSHPEGHLPLVHHHRQVGNRVASRGLQRRIQFLQGLQKAHRAVTARVSPTG